MIKLNNFHKLLFLLFLSSCTVPIVVEEKENIATEKVSDESYFTKTSVILSDIEDYEIQLSTLESFTISESLGDYEISHKNLPYPGVAKISNPNDLSEYIVVRNVKNTTNSKLQISENLSSILQVNSRIYIEYLKDESLRLRNVEDSKEQSRVKMDDTEISFESLEDEQTELSASLDKEKIKEEKKCQSVQMDQSQTLLKYTTPSTFHLYRNQTVNGYPLLRKSKRLFSKNVMRMSKPYRMCVG